MRAGREGRRAVDAWRRRTLAALGLVAAFLLLAVGPVSAEAAKRAFVIRDARITESSGLARDPIGQRYWTVNDSGDTGVVYALSTSGQVQGTLSFNAQPVDVEALALRSNRLWIGDIGDNRAVRSKITVYYFDNPAPSVGVRPYRSYDFVYPDGAHDAEALLVGAGGRVYVVTKAARGAIYRAPKVLSATAPNRLRKVADAPAMVTDGTFLPGTDRVALRTYTTVYVLDSGDDWKSVAQADAPDQPQGESITATLDRTALLVGSEGRRSRVWEMPIPERERAPASPSPSPSPSPSSGSEAPADEPDQSDSDGGTATPGRQGTAAAVGLAAVVALIAGAVAVGVRRR